MVNPSTISEINQVIEAYFKENSSPTIVPVKELMPAFIGAGIFAKDIRNGLPIRQILRELDEANHLQLIPALYAERNGQSTYWYFIADNTTVPTTPYKRDEKSIAGKEDSLSRAQSDATYVIDLCDRVLSRKANRKKRFDFLLGDVHKDGVSRTKLPVDAFYEHLQLVVGYKEMPASDPGAPFYKSRMKTVSGVTREEQRRLYDKRRAELLPKHQIDLVVISWSDFLIDAQNRIIRNEERDIKVVQNALKKIIQKNS